MELIRDLPKGPLDVYRKKASFNWKSMKLHLDGEEGVEYQVRLLFAQFFFRKLVGCKFPRFCNENCVIEKWMRNCSCKVKVSACK